MKTKIKTVEKFRRLNKLLAVVMITLLSVTMVGAGFFKVFAEYKTNHADLTDIVIEVIAAVALILTVGIIIIKFFEALFDIVALNSETRYMAAGRHDEDFTVEDEEYDDDDEDDEDDDDEDEDEDDGYSEIKAEPQTNITDDISCGIILTDESDR